MTSNHLTSFFHPKSNSLTRSATIKSNSTDSQQFNAGKSESSKAIKRSSTLSKVKRFGSMLVRNKQRPMIDTSSVMLSNSCTSLTSLSFTTNDDSEEEEHVITPNASTTQFKDLSITVISPTVSQMDLGMMSVTPKNQTNQLSTTAETLEPSSSSSALQQAILNQELRNSVSLKPELTKLEKVFPKKQEPISDVLMIKDQLRMAFEQIDLEIEQEFEFSHNQMLESIKTTSRTLY